MANNVNVSFLKGTQNSFNELKSYVAGAFYLTTDTNRLYFADSTSKANYLNKYVHTVTTTSEISTAYTNKSIVVGDFVYVSGLNALVVITENGGYKQINAYKNTDTIVNSVDFKKDTSKEDEVVFTFTLDQTAYDLEKKAGYGDDGAESNTQPESPITGTFTITASDIKDIIKTSVDVKATQDGTNQVTVSTSGTGSAGDGFTIVGAGSVLVGGTEDNIVITGTNTKYELASPQNETTIYLNGDDNSETTVDFTAGKQIALDGATDGNIKISHSTVGTTHTENTTAVTINDNATFTAINAITTDNGHLTGYTTQTYKLPTRAKYEITELDIKGGDVTATIKDTNSNHESTATAEDVLYYTVGKDSKYKKTIYNQGDLDVYTAGEVDEKLKGVNAMMYRGTVGTGGTFTSLPASNVSIGDTYKVVSAGTYAGLAGCEVGDIFIATIATDSVEDANGYIPEGKIVWTYIPSGDDYDAQFSFTTYDSENRIALTEDNLTKEKGSIEFLTTANGGIEITTEASGNKNQDASVSIEHKAYETEHKPDTATASVAGGQFTAITGVVTDKGHLTEYTTTTYTLPPDKDSKYGFGAQAGNTNQSKLVLTGSGTANGQEDIVTLIGSTDINITTNSDSDTVTLKHATPVSHGTNTDKTISVDTSATAVGTVTTDSNGITTFHAFTDLKFNSTGHILSATSKKFTLPADSQYIFEDKAELRKLDTTNGFKWTNTVTGSKGANGQISSHSLSLMSDSLNIRENANNNKDTGDFILDINLEWGSF